MPDQTTNSDVAPDETPSRTVFITGCSSGLGLGLTRTALARGWRVLGTARHVPELGKQPNFRFVSCDLSRRADIPPALRRLFSDVSSLDLVILNAGILGPFGDLTEQDEDDMQRVMQVNLWANKTILDVLSGEQISVKQVVAVSSGASVSGNRGWGGYALSKAALNMLVKLAAAEHPETHFCALAPGLVDTAMQDQLCSYPADPRYPALDKLRASRGTPQMPDGDEIAPRLLDAMDQFPQRVSSGEYVDIRKFEFSA